MAVTFTLAQGGQAGPRAGTLHLPRGDVPTPVFMPVGTRAAVKAATADQVAATGARLLLSNAYHLALRPGAGVVEGAGGLHAFMGWDGSILTDSGGFQVFSLAPLARVADQGVTFQSSYDGSSVQFTPQGVVELQARLGSDIAMVLDQCVPGDASHEVAREAMERTLAWAEASRQALERWPSTLFAIVQGSTYQDLREACADELTAMDFPGYAVGGLSVGEPLAVMEEVLSYTLPRLPVDKPRYVMGVGPPTTLLACVARGADMFDCVLPTRNARNGYLFTRKGVVRIKNAAFATSDEPIDSDCPCLACRTVSRAYLRHLFNVGEFVGLTLATVHNLTYFHDLMEGAREAILEGRFESYQREVEGVYGV